MSYNCFKATSTYLLVVQRPIGLLASAIGFIKLMGSILIDSSKTPTIKQ